MKWAKTTLGDILQLSYGKSLPERNRELGEIPVYGSGGIGGFHNNALVKGPGVIVGRKGTIGSVFFEERDFFPIDTAYFVEPKNDKLDIRFAYYLLKNLPLSSFNSDAAVPGLNRERALSLEVNLPSWDEQAVIVRVLSEYDELIKSNLRRMALLEESARLLYREWFVHFRFPGHEHIGFVNGLPDRWSIAKLDDLCIIGRGASPRPIMDFMGGEVPWFKIGDATASESPFVFDTKEHVTDEGAKRSVFLEPGSLILSNSATCGIPYFTGVAGCVHDGWLHFSSYKRISPLFLYYFLFCKKDELVSSVGDGSTQKNLNTDAVGRLKACLPDSDELLFQFDDVVKPIHSLISNVAKQNNALREARDILLPRLMSGEIKV